MYYHYDANGLLIGESDAQGLVRREYVYLGMMPVAQIDIDSQGQESVVYFLTDQLATPRLGIDQSQTIVWKWESDAYGSIGPSGSATVNLRFAGQYFDAESGWYYNWNRYYLPGEGRYLTSDPLGLDAGMNTYTYVRENPLNYIDVYGLAELLIWPPTDRTYGHAALLLDDGTYISNWPQNDGDDTIEKPRNACFECDKRGEGGEEPLSTPINGLNEKAIKKWWEEEQKNSFYYWHALYHNCSDTVVEALKKGGADVPYHFINSPTDLLFDYYNATTTHRYK